MQKLVFLLVAIATFSGASNIRAVDPEELQAIWQTIYEETLSVVHENQIYLRALETPVEYYSAVAVRQFVANMSEVATTYWEHVKQIETDDTADCVKKVNAQLYSYNVTLLHEYERTLGEVRYAALDGFKNATNEVNDVQSQVLAIDVKVKACSDAECAASLQEEILQFHKDSIVALKKSLNDGDAALDTFYADSAVVQLDRDVYKKSLDVLDDQLTQCDA